MSSYDDEDDDDLDLFDDPDLADEDDEDYEEDEVEMAALEAGGIGGLAGLDDGELSQYGEPQSDPAMRPVLEAGGGESEGFEEAERELVDHAEHGDQGHEVEDDAFSGEREADLAGIDYGEADDVEPRGL